MPVYRFYLLDDTGRPIRLIDAECRDDEAARLAAFENLDRYAAATADLWQGLRFLEKMSRSSDNSATPRGE